MAGRRAGTGAPIFRVASEAQDAVLTVQLGCKGAAGRSCQLSVLNHRKIIEGYASADATGELFQLGGNLIKA